MDIGKPKHHIYTLVTLLLAISFIWLLATNPELSEKIVGAIAFIILFSVFYIIIYHLFKDTSEEYHDYDDRFR
jgi:membrane protein YdbS with pleckstrin-like domain